MASCLLAAHEFAPTHMDIVRGLIGHPKVILLDPAERDFIPEGRGMEALGFPMLFQSAQANRQLGKAPTFDGAFAELTERCSTAIAAGRVEIRRSYDLKLAQSITMGNVDTGFPVDIQGLRNCYKFLCRDQAILSSVLDDSLRVLIRTKGFAPYEPEQADSTVNNEEPLPLLAGDFANEELRVQFTLACRARIASALKHLALGNAYDAVPELDDRIYGTLIGKLVDDANRFVDRVKTDVYHQKKRIVADLVIDMFCDDEALAECSIDYIIAQRDRGNRSISEVREEFLDEIRKYEEDGQVSLERFKELVEQRLKKVGETFMEYESRFSNVGLKVVGKLTTRAALTTEIMKFVYPTVGLHELVLAAVGNLGGIIADKEVRDLLQHRRHRNKLPELALYRSLSPFR